MTAADNKATKGVAGVDSVLAARLEWTAPGGDFDQGKGKQTWPRNGMHGSESRAVYACYAWAGFGVLKVREKDDG